MTEFASLCVYSLTFLLMTNVILTRAVGAGLSVSISRSYRYVLVFGGCVTLTSVAASVPAFLLTLLLRDLSFARAIEPLVYSLLLCGMYVAVHFLLRAFLPSIYARYSSDVAHAMLNLVVMTALVLPFREKLTFGGSVLFALETGLAFLVGTLLVLEGQKRLSLAKTPRVFRGLPVMLLYIGILAMALYGFVGHQLPY